MTLAIPLAVSAPLLFPAIPAAADDTPPGTLTSTSSTATDPLAGATAKERAALAKEIAKANSRPIKPDKTTSANKGIQAQSAYGSKPTRKGTILVTSDAYKGLIPTGHAAMVYDKSWVIEAMPNGVVWGLNDWHKGGVHDQAFGVTVGRTTVKQDAAAAKWAKKQLGKPYNYNYLKTWIRNKFYCSQLVWAAFKDKNKVNLNTDFGKVKLLKKDKKNCITIFGRTYCGITVGTYNPIHPMELVNNSKVILLWRKK